MENYDRYIFDTPEQEAEARREFEDTFKQNTERDSDGTYIDATTRMSWIGFRAAWRHWQRKCVKRQGPV